MRSIREALGLSLDAYAQRPGLASRSTARQIETAEVEETITVKRLRAAADALDCDLVVLVLPRKSLAEESEDSESKLRLVRYERAAHTMALESQAVAEERLLEISKLVDRKRKNKGTPH